MGEEWSMFKCMWGEEGLESIKVLTSCIQNVHFLYLQFRCVLQLLRMSI